MRVLSARALSVFGIAGALVTVTLSSPRAANFWYRGFCGCAELTNTSNQRGSLRSHILFKQS